MKKRFSNTFKTTNVTKLTKAILKSFYRVLQITSKWKTRTKTTCQFFKGCWILAYFWQANYHNFGYILGKVAQIHFLKKPTQNTPTFISIEPPITKLRSFKNIKNWCFLAAVSSLWMTFWILNESNIWAKVYHIWKMEVWESTIVEITGRRSCYFISLNIG